MKMTFRAPTGVGLNNLETPALILDIAKMRANILRLRSRVRGSHVRLRPHLKTVKSVDVARELLTDIRGPATVSTLGEAEVFSAAGTQDILYAVGISPDKLGRVADLRRRGVNLSVLLDSVQQAKDVGRLSALVGHGIPTWVEIDVDGHRSGVKSESKELLQIAHELASGGARLAGVLAHAGESYESCGNEALVVASENERFQAVDAANRLRSAGFEVPEVSVGSTPTAFSLQNFDGISEIRAGVYVFFDLMMAELGICNIADIAISVLSTVIGHQSDKRWIIVDAGWSALSADRGKSRHPTDQSYGLVCDLDGKPFRDLCVIRANQEHGIVSLCGGSDAKLPNLPIGTRIRILPNHACATSMQHEGYWASEDVRADNLSWWPRLRGW